LVSRLTSQNVSAAVSSSDLVVKTEHVNADPLVQHVAETSRETVDDFSENDDMQALHHNEAVVQSAAVLHQHAVASQHFESCETIPSDAAPQDEVKYITGDVVCVEGASQCLESVPSRAAIQQGDVSVKTEPVNIALITGDSLQQKVHKELQHRPSLFDDHPQSEARVADTLLLHEAECTNDVLQEDSILTNEVMQDAAELGQEVSSNSTVLHIDVAPNDYSLEPVSDGDNCVLQSAVEICERKKEVEEREVDTGTVRSSTEVSDTDQVDSLLSANECTQLGLVETRNNSTVAEVSRKVATTVDQDSTSDSVCLGLVSDNSAESPAVCDEAVKPDDFVPCSSDTLGVDDSQDVDDSSPETADECSVADKGCAIFHHSCFDHYWASNVVHNTVTVTLRVIPLRRTLRFTKLQTPAIFFHNFNKYWSISVIFVAENLQKLCSVFIRRLQI